jgi:hypothetical protein
MANLEVFEASRMTYVKQQDKRLCVQAGCTATSFFGLAAAQNQKATAQPPGMVRSFKSEIKTLTPHKNREYI